jgi:uncharacterized protein
MDMAHQRFGLTLMVNHACNLRCTYCYTGAKFSSPMPMAIGVTAIDRAFRNLQPAGLLDLGFFGGEPLLESSRILEWMRYARTRALASEKTVQFSVTTNGTFTTENAWHVMMAKDLELAVSFDAHPRIHDRHRRTLQGQGSAAVVETTLRRLIEAGKAFRVNVVARPDNLDELPEGLTYLQTMGVRQVNLSLDLWTNWNVGDGRRLEKLVERAAEMWRDWLPDFNLNWFDAKAGELAGLPRSEAGSCCGFGSGEIAVAPSGNLYPCERLIGEDRADQPQRVAGHVLDGQDQLGNAPPAFAVCGACASCAIASACDTRCRCSNFVRTGDVHRPDGLLCLLNKATAVATSRVLARDGSRNPDQRVSNERYSYVA